MLKHLVSLKKVTYTKFDEKSSVLFERNAKRIIDSFCVSSIGRSEGVHVSPNAKKIAYSSFDLNKIIVFDFALTSERDIEIEKCVNYGDNLNSPHDFAWIDDKTIIVANREGPAVIFSVTDGNFYALRTIKEMSNSNSVVAILKDKTIRLFFCRTSHRLDYCELDEGLNTISSGTLMTAADLKVPDGVAASPLGNKLAITSALDDRVVILNLDDGNFFTLGNAKRPHGVSFLTENLVLSTGGGDPFITCWDVKNHSMRFKLKALNEEQYALRYSEAEGGVKGVCFCPKLKMLFATCPNAPFLVFDAKGIS